MSKFSDHFSLLKTQAELDFIDISLDKDIPLFIDPYVFSRRKDLWSEKCNNAIVSFFQSVIDRVKRGDDESAFSLLSELREPNETHLGLSSGRPSGRGVGHLQARELLNRLKGSRAAATGLLTDISDCELFIEGIGPDKISDITTSVLRRHLIEYTQDQCALHKIPIIGTVASGAMWDENTEEWQHDYVSLPVAGDQKIILVPKASVRWSFAFSAARFYNHFVLNYLQASYQPQFARLGRTIREGRSVTKKELKEQYPFSKKFLTDFSLQNPHVLQKYKESVGASDEVTNEELDENFDERAFCDALIGTLQEVQPGASSASQYHDLCIGIIEFIFFPHLIYPEKEAEIHSGKKRIDIRYTNNSKDGFFYRMRTTVGIAAHKIVVECKNYRNEMANPELDQISSRFSPQRGRLGLLVGRSFDNRARFIDRCRDTFKDDRGLIVPLVDNDIISFLNLIKRGLRNEIDREMDRRFAEIMAG